MANIFISHFAFESPGSSKTITPCYYEGFIKTLLRNGNNILHMHSNDFIYNPWNGNNILKNIDKKKLYNQISTFNPDIAFLFNNSTVPNLHKHISCPKVIMQADSPQYYSDKEHLKKHAKEYYFSCSNNEILSLATQLFNCDKNKTFLSQFATDFAPEDMVQTKNISFIGNNFQSFHTDEKGFSPFYPDLENLQNRYELHKYKEAFIDIYSNYPNKLLQSNDKNDFFSDFIVKLMGGHERRKVLELLVDLGLSIYGIGWNNLFDSSIDLALSFDNRKICSIKDNQDIYNSSKICINISHPQTKNGIPWRVLDIAATNACLLSDARQDIADFFGKIEIPTYTNRFDARRLAIKLLKDNIYRQELVTQIQNFVHAHGRFESRFQDFESFFNISLLNKHEGRYQRITNENTGDNSYHSQILLSSIIKRMPPKIQNMLYSIFLKINSNGRFEKLKHKYKNHINKK